MFEGQHFQNGYITRDIEKAIAAFRTRGGVEKVISFEAPVEVATPKGRGTAVSKIAFIWVNNLQYELIQPLADPLGIYGNCVSNGGPLRFHQTCVRVADWTDFRARVAKQDLPVAMERDLGGDSLKFLYLDARKQVGHYLEYVWMTDAAWEQNRSM